MCLDEVIDAICRALQEELDGAQYHHQQGHTLLAWFSEGYADGLRKALQYIEMYREPKKKRQRPPALPQIPLIKEIRNNEIISYFPRFVKTGGVLGGRAESRILHCDPHPRAF